MNYVSNAKPFFSSWTSHPWQLSSLKSAFRAIDPVLQQLLKSSYVCFAPIPEPHPSTKRLINSQIFMFNLPFPLPVLSPALKHLVTLCQRDISRHQIPPAEMVVAAQGPCAADSTSLTADGYSYGQSVSTRASNKSGAWTQRIRLYREGLGTARWTPNSATEAYFVGSGKGANGAAQRRGQFNYPLTIIFGLDDLAFDIRVVLNGIEDFFLLAKKAATQEQRSHVVRLPGQSHWFFGQKNGARIVEETLLYLLDRRGGDMRKSERNSLENALAERAGAGELTVDSYPS